MAKGCGSTWTGCYTLSLYRAERGGTRPHASLWGGGAVHMDLSALIRGAPITDPPPPREGPS